MTFNYTIDNNPRLIEALVDTITSVPVTKVTVEPADSILDVNLVIDSPELDKDAILALGVLIGTTKHAVLTHYDKFY